MAARGLRFQPRPRGDGEKVLRDGSINQAKPGRANQNRSVWKRLAFGTGVLTGEFYIQQKRCQARFIFHITLGSPQDDLLVWAFTLRNAEEQ